MDLNPPGPPWPKEDLKQEEGMVKSSQGALALCRGVSRRASVMQSGENMKSWTYRGAFWKMNLCDPAMGRRERGHELSVSLRFRAWGPG